MQSRIRFVSALAGVCVASWLAAAEIVVSASALRLKTDAIELSGDFRTGTVSFKGAGFELSGQGLLLVARPDGSVSSLLEGGADRSVRDPDAVAAVLGTGTGPVIVGLANAAGRAGTACMPLKVMGLPAGVYAAYDFVSNALAGPVATSLLQPLAAGQPAVLALVAAADHPVLVAGPDTLAKPELTVASWDGAKKALSGTTPLEAGKPCELRILAAPVPNPWQADSASVAGGEAAVKQTGEWVRVTLTCPKAGSTKWTVLFTAATSAGPAAAATLTAMAAAPRCVVLNSSVYGMNVRVRRQDGREFPLDASPCSDTQVVPDTSYTYSLEAIDWSGKARALASATVQTPARAALPPAPEVHLADLEPLKATNGWNGNPRRDKSIEDHPLRIRGEEFKRGMGVHAHSELVYAVKPEWKRFVAVVGTDDEQPGGSIRFSVLADGKPLMQTPVLTSDDDRFSIDVQIPAGTQQLSLVVDDAGNGIGCDHGDWANAGFLAAK